METTTIELPEATPGTRRRLLVHRFGRPGARPKAYLQAALHGDELPGVLVLLALEERLHRLEAAGAVTGEILLVPVANPIGLSQILIASHVGRRDLGDFSNFNRGWPDLAEPVAQRVGPSLGADAGRNVALIRDAMRAVVAELPAVGENAAWRKSLLALAVDADLVLDLHCDLEAALHIYLGTPLWPAATDLAADLGSEATLLAEESGGNPFDETFSTPWWQLARRFPDAAIPFACLAATLEFRGLVDLDPAQADADADALVRFLTRRGVLAGDPGPLPPLRAPATPLAAVALVKAPTGGLLHHAVEPGARVEAGDPLAILIDPLAPPDTRRTEIRAPIAGVVFARAQCRLARAGGWICKIAGTEPLPERKGKLLPD